jgi:hypothetical protein
MASIIRRAPLTQRTSLASHTDTARKIAAAFIEAADEIDSPV